MIFPAPRSCFSGKTRLWPWMVTLLYCSMSSVYTPGGRVLGILSSGSLEDVDAGVGMAAVAGLAWLDGCSWKWLCVLLQVTL